MIDAVIQWVLTQAQGQIFGGLAAASIIGSAAFYLRKFPEQLLTLAERLFTIEIAVRSDDAMYGVVSHWLANQPFMERSRRLRLVSLVSRHGLRKASKVPVPDDDDDGPRLPEWTLVPAAGTHWAIFQGAILKISVDDGTSGAPDNAANSKNLSYVIETIRITILGRNRSAVSALICEAGAMIKAEDYRVRVYTSDGRYWNRSMRKMPRPLASVVTANDVGQRVLDDMRLFLDAREWYAQRGIPWRRGYSFDGPPGTGKSSLAMALASELKCGIYAIGLGTTLTDTDVAVLLSSVPERAIVLIEDIDTFAVAQSRVVQGVNGKDDKGMLTLSGLLNALDGVAASEGRILIITTNHPDRLDAALNRAGRVDMAVHLGNFRPPESLKLWKLFFGTDHPMEAEFFATVPVNMQPAALQGILMRHAKEPWAVIDAVRGKGAA